MGKPSIQIDIEGADSIMAFFTEMKAIGDSQKFRQAMYDAAVAGESFVKAELQRMVYDSPPSPYYKRTRELIKRTTARSKVEKKGGALIAAVESAIFYAKYVQFGTENAKGETLMPARPYMTAGLNAGAETIVRILANAI